LNKERIVVIFHLDVPGMKRSEMSKEGNSLLLGCFGAGLKFGKVGIQADVQTGKWELMETWRHVPDRRRDLHWTIPFQSHEAFDESGEDKKEPYLMVNSESVMIRQKFPSKFGNQSKIDIIHISDTQTSKIAWYANWAPRFEENIVNFDMGVFQVNDVVANK
jgi:hypothetical protein